MAHISPLYIWAVTFSLGRGNLTIVLSFLLGHIPLLSVRCFGEQAHHATSIPALSFYIWSQAVAQVLQDLGTWQIHWSWEPRIYVPWWRTFRWQMKGWQVKWRSPDSHNLPQCKMLAAVSLSLLVLNSCFTVQIDLCRLTFQWTYIVSFKGKAAI